MAEKIEKKQLGSLGMLVALPLILITPLVISYYMMWLGTIPPINVLLIIFSLVLIGALLMFKPVFTLTKLYGIEVPKLLLSAYILFYGGINLILLWGISLLEAGGDLLMLAAELTLGSTFILLANYTSKFKELTVGICGKKFRTRYELSSLLLIAGILIPMDVTLMVVGLRPLRLIGSDEAGYMLVLIRFFAHAVLIVASLLATLGMLVFKKAVQDFCFRLGSMDALIKKEK